MENTKLKIGDQAPQFILKDKDENEVKLSDYKGMWVILYFYPKDNTKGCTLEAKDFTEQTHEFSKLNAEIIGVSPDSPKSHQKFIDKHELKILLLSDPEHKVLEDYDFWQIKKMYGKEYYGVVRSTFVINPEGKIAALWMKVRVKDHVEKVKIRLSELQSK